MCEEILDIDSFLAENSASNPGINTVYALKRSDNWYELTDLFGELVLTLNAGVRQTGLDTPDMVNRMTYHSIGMIAHVARCAIVKIVDVAIRQQIERRKIAHCLRTEA